MVLRNGFLASLSHLILHLAEDEPLRLILLVVLTFLLFVSHNSAAHELVMRITAFIWRL